MPIKKLPKKMEKQKFDLFLSEPKITPASEIHHYKDETSSSSSKPCKHTSLTITTELMDNVENVRIYTKIVKSFPNVKTEISIFSLLTEIQEFCHSASKLISSSPDVLLFSYLSKPLDLLCDTIYALLQIFNKNKTKKVSNLHKVNYNKVSLENYLKDLSLLAKFCNFAKYLLIKQHRSLNNEKSLTATLKGDSLSTTLIPLLNKQELLSKTHNVLSSDSHKETGTTIILQTKEDLYKEKKALFNEIEDLKKEVINNYRKLINNGNPEGYKRIGNFIYKHSTDKTTDIAKYWLFLSSENFEDEFVFYNLGRIYEREGSNGNKDVFNISIAYFRKAAQQGLTKSYNRLGQIYEFYINDEGKAKEYYKEGVDKGDVFCMNNLARLILTKITLKNNTEKNIKNNKENNKDKELLERSERRNDFYTFKESVSDCKKHQEFTFSIPNKFNKDLHIKVKHALSLLKKACGLKNEHALINLGIVYEDGEYIEKDLILAKNLYLEAEKVVKIKTKQKHKETKLLEKIHYLLGKVYYKLGGFENAFLRFSKVKTRGKFGCFGTSTDIYLGLLFEHGQFVQVNRNRARTHYLWACGKDNSNLKALFKLGELNYNENFEGLKEKGKEQLIECANKNVTEAVIKVAGIYEAEGNYEKAKEYYERINDGEVINVDEQIKRLSKIKEIGSSEIKDRIEEMDDEVNEMEENEKAIKRLFHGDKNEGLRISNDILSYFVEDHL
eukprot:GAHX01001707.1.p1 GENE.GAHX01001707.1~~GAHX01001707.1.p1  ORF type:complete len:727 (+),score=206.07 GAHX01001707.1:790-2970(+)